MSDLKKLGMTELIALHNDLAEKLGVSTETSFKSLGAARTAITNLESKMNQATHTDDPVDGMTDIPAETATASAEAGDRSKYNSSGKRGPNQGVGSFAKEQIAAGKTNAEVLALVKSQFPNAKTTTGCIAFYRTAMAKGPQGKSPETLRAEAQALLAKAEAVEAAQAAAKAAADAKAAEAQPAVA
jgi:hypothetical protein